MGLDMSAVVKLERNPGPAEAHERVERALDAQVLVVFELPDGSEGEKHFKMGHTVEVLKSHVEEEFEIPMAAQSLYLDDALMLDPLSLSDYPPLRGVAARARRVALRHARPFFVGRSRPPGTASSASTARSPSARGRSEPGARRRARGGRDVYSEGGEGGGSGKGGGGSGPKVK